MAQRAHRRCARRRPGARAGSPAPLSRRASNRWEQQGVGKVMHRFEVWAPSASRVAVAVNGGSLPMAGPDDQGWWRVGVEGAGPGTDYGFQVNNDSAVYPDPRSLWQPQGVHGLSRVYDQNA